MKKHLITSLLMTVATTILLGIVYPLLITGLAQLFFPDKANGQLIRVHETVVGSHLIGQPFSGPGFFHSRLSAAGAGYDATASAGSQLGPTNHTLVERISADSARLSAGNLGKPVPVDLVTSSASGLDPEITPAAAAFQIPRVAQERGISEDTVRKIVQQHTLSRQLGFLGEPRVNVLDLNLSLLQISR